MSRCGLAAVWPRCGLIFQSAADYWREKHGRHPELRSFNFGAIQAGNDVVNDHFCIQVSAERSEKFGDGPVRWGTTLYKASHRRATAQLREGRD